MEDRGVLQLLNPSHMMHLFANKQQKYVTSLRSTTFSREEWGSFGSAYEPVLEDNCLINRRLYGTAACKDPGASRPFLLIVVISFCPLGLSARRAFVLGIYYFANSRVSVSDHGRLMYRRHEVAVIQWD